MVSKIAKEGLHPSYIILPPPFDKGGGQRGRVTIIKHKSQKEVKTMSRVQPIVALVLRAIALAMAVASIVLGILGTTSLETIVPLLGIGLFALALAGLQTTKVD